MTDETGITGGSAVWDRAGMAVLQSAAKAVLNRFSGETVLEIPVLTESSAALVRKLLPASQSIGLRRAELDLTK